MEIEIENVNIIFYSIIAIVIVFLIARKISKFKKGVIIANTKYVKKTKYYKYLLFKNIVTARAKKLDDNVLNDKIDALGGGEYTINDIFDVISRDDLNIPLPSAGAAPTYGSCNKCW